MLIRVVYSDGQMLFCNSDCVAVNLLSYVKKQTDNLDCDVVDLADETGLVLELDDHKLQLASKRLAQKGERFILVEKRQKDPNDEDFDPAIPYYYAALLDDCASLYPDIKTFYTVSMEEKRQAKHAKPSKRDRGGVTPQPSATKIKSDQKQMPSSSRIPSTTNVAAKGKKKHAA